MTWGPAPVGRRERALVLVLALAAAARVLLMAAAFPFFTNVDEHRHVDAVLKYARGYLPRPDNDAYEPEMPLLLGLYGSPEYHLAPGRQPPPPSWRGDSQDLSRRVESGEALLRRRHNLEATQPPLYYALAGGWLRLGRLLGLDGGALLYWLRALGAVGMFALVWLTHAGLCRAYAGDALLRLGVPALLVVFPQDSLYYVTRDALSPLLFAAGFFACVGLGERPARTALAFGAAGLACAAALLAKYANAGLLAVAAACTALALARRAEARSLRGEGGRWLVLWVAIGAPLCWWLARNELLFGDLLGTASKVERMGWTHRSFAEYWDHPLFTPSGLAVFVVELVPRFWRGQLAWHGEVLAQRGADRFYTVSSLLLLALAGLRVARRGARHGARLLEGMSGVALLASVGLLAALSPLYGFGERTNPSRDLPFFVQGRLISGAMVPFLVLYVSGIREAAGRLPARVATPVAWAALALVAVVVVASELSLSLDIFASPYNWYHLP